MTSTEDDDPARSNTEDASGQVNHIEPDPQRLSASQNDLAADDNSDPSNNTQSGLDSLRTRLASATQRLTQSVIDDASSGRGSTSSTTRHLRNEVKELSESIICLEHAFSTLSRTFVAPTPPSTLAASTSQSHHADRPVTLPSGLPKFQRLASSTMSVREFLTTFEDRLRAHGYPIRRHVDALLTCCTNTEADWCRSELLGLTRSDAKTKFIEHFAGGDMMEHFREQLETISRQPKEGLRAFADRYVQSIRMMMGK